MNAALILETFMLVLFGLSWPVNILKSFRAKTAKGKSVLFLCFVWAGYLCGLLAKILAGSITYVVWIYLVNILMVTIDMLLFLRNKRLDKKAVKENTMQKPV